MSSAASASSSSDGYSNDGLKHGKLPNNLPLSRRPSLTTSVSAARRESRKGSIVRNDSAASSRATEGAPIFDFGPVYSAGERNQQLNARIDNYLNDYPEHLERVRSAPSGGNPRWGSLSLSREIAEPETPIYEEPEAQEEEVAKKGKSWRRKSKDLTGFAKAAKRGSIDLGRFFR
jgi:hypothetical protein